MATKAIRSKHSKKGGRHGRTVRANPSRPRFSSKIIKAGALIPDTRILLNCWDENSSVVDNLARIRRENPFAKASRRRVENILAVFRQRYLASDDVLRGLVLLSRAHETGRALERVLYFHAVQADSLLRAVVLEHIWPLQAAGKRRVTTPALVERLLGFSRNGKTEAPWREATARRIAQGVLSLLRDFGCLEGSIRKSIAPAFVPVDAFAYVAFLLSQPPWNFSGAKLLETEEWQVLLLSPEAVERGFLEAHQARLLTFESAGSIVRVQFPADTVEAYARFLAERAH